MIHDTCCCIHDTHDTCSYVRNNHIAAPDGRYAGGDTVQQIFLHSQLRPLRHSRGEILNHNVQSSLPYKVILIYLTERLFNFQPFLAALGLFNDSTDLTVEDLAAGYQYDTSRYK